MQEVKERIIKLNNSLGLKTEFCDCGEGILGYSMKDTIYLNINIEQDLEKTNKHEILHFYEETETFIKMKEEILRLNKDKLKKIYEEYELRYQGLYTKEEIENGIIDTEIVIDTLIDNYIVETKEGLKVGNYVLGKIKDELEYKRYLNMTIKNSVENMKLTKWEKLFVMNYYDGKDNKMPGQQDKYEQIRNDIKKEYERLCDLEKEEFILDTSSKEIERKYESEIKALQARGEDTTWLEQNKERLLEELASKFSNQLYEEYKHIVDYIRTTEYEEAFKVLMLRETLTKTYKIDKKEEKNNTIVKKRDMHNTIATHMTLNETVLKTIYENIDDYNNFANLYFAGLEIFNNKIIEKSEITLDDVETYNKGKWIKFEGKTSNEEEYIKNVQELSSLVSDTPWCTKQLASSQLADGDFYVFVDNENKPHIAVKMSGNEIDEVRGIKNGDKQELEEEYRDVALSFLEKNKEIKNGKEWIEKEEWNKRLIEYNEKIESNEITQDDIPNLINDIIYHQDYKSHFGENTNKEKLINNLGKIKDKLAIYYNYAEEEIYAGNLDYSKYQDSYINTYKIILGNVNFANSEEIDLSNLEIIGGFANFSDSLIKNLGNLKTIGGYADFENSQVKDLSSLELIGGYASFWNIQVENLSSLETIGSFANFSDSLIKNLGNLKTIGGAVSFVNSQVKDLSSLELIGGYANFRDSQVENLSSLEIIGGFAEFENSQVKDLNNLEIIGGYANFYDSKIKNLSNLKTIGGDAVFENSQVKDLSSLKTIGGDANFVQSQVENLSSLKKIGGMASFWNSQVEDISSLEIIESGGDDVFGNSPLEGKYIVENGKVISLLKDIDNTENKIR